MTTVGAERTITTKLVKAGVLLLLVAVLYGAAMAEKKGSPVSIRACTLRGMKALFALLSLITFASYATTPETSLVGCSGSQTPIVSTLVQDGEKLGACVIGQVVAGDEDPATIAKACVGVLVADIGDIINTFLAKLPDAGPLNAEFVARAHRVVLKTDAINLANRQR